MRTLIAIAAMVAGCGDNLAGAPPPDSAPAPDILVQLQRLPGVTVTEQMPVHAPPGYRYFTLRVTQPIDHDSPADGTFQQQVSLIHIDQSAPMVAYTSGYDDYVLDNAAEPTLLLHANQLSIEHRYFGNSIPVPTDWTKLTIRQMAADEHAIIELLTPIYRAAWITSGASKGGMTAIYHHRFYPDDVAGTVAYVAPISFSVPDSRYDAFLDSVGTDPCRSAVKAAATEMLHNRRAALQTRAQTQATAMSYSYTRIALAPAVESAIRDLEWPFWQYFGIHACNLVPATNATDDAMFSFLDLVSPVSFSDDAETAAFEAYFYQAYAQLGSPGPASMRGDAPPSYLAPYVQFSEADYTGTFPIGVTLPAFDTSAMQDIDHWIQTEGSHLVFAYGQWDPWTAGAFQLGAATDSLEVVVAQGTHGSELGDLAPANRDAAFAKLATWTGVTPTMTMQRAHLPRPHHRRLEPSATAQHPSRHGP